MSESRVVITAQADQAIREFDRLRAQATGSLRQVADLGGKLDSIKSTMGGIVTFVLGGLGVGAFTGMVKGAIDTMDNLKDLSTTTKITVEDLSGLAMAAKQSGSDLDATAAVIAKFTVNMSKNSERFARLGVTSKEPLEAFKQFADVFAAIEDPELRAGLAAAALDRSWKGAAPLLAEGSKRIGEMIEKGKAQAQVTAEMAARADEFNDQMVEMQTVIDGAKMKLAQDMLPALTQVTKAILDAYEESGKLQAVWVAMGALGAFLFTDEFSSATVKIKNLRTELVDLEADLALSKDAPAIGFIGRALFGKSAEVLEKEVAAAKGQIKSLQDQIDRPAKDAASKAAAENADKEKREKDKAAEEAARKAKEFLQQGQADEKAAADSSLALRKANIDAEKAQRAEALAVMAEMNRQGLASDAQYYVAKRQAALAAGTDAVRIKNAEIATLRAYHAKDAAEQAAINGKIAVLHTEKNEALRASLAAADLLRKQYIYDSAAPARAAQAGADAEIAGVDKEVAALREQFENYNKLPAAITATTIAKLEARGVALETNEGTEQEIANNNRLIESLKARARWETKVAAQDKGSDLTRATELLAVMTSLDDITQEAAAGMADAFGKVGSAIGGLTTALTGYGRTQAAIAAELAASVENAKGDKTKIFQANAAAAQKSAQAQLKSYGDMANAAKGFFKENSRGYKAMEGAEKAYRAFETAMAIKTMLTKSGLIQAFTGLFVASKATETAATTASVAPDIAASMAKGQAAATAGVANQAQGDPYTAWGRIAAMAAVMAALGFAVSGGGSKVSVSEQRQATQGTGTVFGDPKAKSDSIARSIELAAANSSIELNYTAGMLRALLSIENSLSGLGNLLIRGSGVTGKVPATVRALGDGKAFSGLGPTGPLSTVVWASQYDKILGKWIGKVTNSVANALFGGKVTALDTGLTANKTTVAGAVAGGLSASQYLDTKKDGGLFHSDKYNTKLTPLGEEANGQFSKIVSDMAGGIKEAGKLLGYEGTAFNARLDAFVVDIGKISLKDLTGEEIQKELEAVFSKLGDDMARWAVGDLAQFQQVGEGYLQTLVRVAANYANLDSVLASVGMTFGAVGLTSLKAREDFIAAAGGIDELAGKFSSFADNYLSEAERLVPVRKYVTEQLAAMNLAHLNSRDAFKDHLLALNPAIDAEQRQIAALLDLEGAFAKVYPATKDLAKSAQDIADERAELQDEWDELTMSSAELQAKALLKYDSANRAFAQQIAMQRKLEESTEAATSALKSTVDGLTATKISTLAYRDSLVLGSLSTLTPMQKYLETQRQYNAAMAKAAASPADSAAASAAQSAATAFLTASQVINASSSAFVGDKAKVLGDMDKLAAIAGAQMSDAQRQLAAFDKQVQGIATLNDTAVDIKQAIVNLGAPATAPVPAFDVGRYMGASDVGRDTLAAELKAQRADNAELRKINADMLAEIRLMRTDAGRHKEDMVGATEGMSREVASSVGEAVERAEYRANNPTRVAPRGR